MADKDKIKRFVTGSRTLLNALLERGEKVPDEVQRLQELVECMDNNAQKIAAALAANRRLGARVTGADTTAQLLKEQKQFISQIVELHKQLSEKPAPTAAQTTE